MPTKDSFDAVIYLAVMHGDSALADLKLGHQNLNFEATERTGQLKSLVRRRTHVITCMRLYDASVVNVLYLLSGAVWSKLAATLVLRHIDSSSLAITTVVMITMHDVPHKTRCVTAAKSM